MKGLWRGRAWVITDTGLGPAVAPSWLPLSDEQRLSELEEERLELWVSLE